MLLLHHTVPSRIGLPYVLLFDQKNLSYEAGPKLGNAGPPPKSSFGSPEKFFLDGDAKERAPKGRCQARGVWGHTPPENFA